MPVYEYVCTTCQNKFELLRSLGRMNDPASCPNCKNGAKRVLSAFITRSKGPKGEAAPAMPSPCAGCSSGSCASCS